jgi:multicomponent Na+:H+ antiporter subunit E
MSQTNVVMRFIWAVELFFWFLWQLWLSNWNVIKLALSFKPRATPGVVDLPLTLTSDLGIAFLANMITLTPGTVSIDVTEVAGERRLLVYVLFMGDPAVVTAEIKNGFEARIKRVFE